MIRQRMDKSNNFWKNRSLMPVALQSVGLEKYTHTLLKLAKC